MGNALFRVGVVMRMGCNKGTWTLIFLSFTVLTLLIPFNKAYSNPLLIARAVLPTVLGRVIAARAIKTGVTEGTYLAVTKATQTGLTKAAMSRGTLVPAGSMLRSSSGALTWAGIGVSLGSLTSEKLAVKGGNLIATSGTQKSDGKWEVIIDGKRYSVDTEPSELNPFIIKPGNLSEESAVIVDSLSSGHKWWQYAFPSSSGKLIVGSVTGIAHSYFYDRASKGQYTCPALNKECSYSLLVDSVVIPDTGSASVKYRYTASYTDSSGNFKTSTYTPVQGIPVYKNKDFDPANEIHFSEVEDVFATDANGFTALDSLKNMKIDLDELRKMINDLLMGASATDDYKGIPIVATNPITTNEIKEAYPNYNDLTYFDYLYPSQSSSSGDVNVSFPSYGNAGGTNPNPDPNPDPSPNPDTPGTKPDETYPDNQRPELDNPPSASEILKPIANLFPELRNVDIGHRVTQCPVAEFSVFEHDFRIDTHCYFIDSNKELIKLIFNIIWILICIRIILSA